MSFTQLPDRIAARMAAFSLVGVANGVVGIAVIVIAGFFGAGAVFANVLGYGAGLLVSFTLNSRLTFRARRLDGYTVLRFLAAFAIAFAVNIAVVKGATVFYGAHKLLASVAGTPFYVVIFYLLCEYWVFRRHPG